LQQGSFRSTHGRSVLGGREGIGGPDSAYSPAFGNQSSQDLFTDEEDICEGEDETHILNGESGMLTKEEQERLKAEEEEEDRKRLIFI
jgi:hypothetical protein